MAADQIIVGDGASGSPRPVAPARPSRLGIIAAAAGGFLCGIVFWHLVGFWSLVNEVAFHRHPGDAPAPPRELAAKSQGRRSGGTETAAAAAAETCSEALPASDGAVRLQPCASGVRRFSPARGIERADFADFGSSPETKLINGAEAGPAPGAPSVGGWAAEVAPATKP